MSIQTLKAADGHELSAYVSAPAGKPRGALVVIQEIFGVNHHIRSVCDCFAAQGWRVISPALFDRVQRGVELGYAENDRTEGRALLGKMQWPLMQMDTQAAIHAVADADKVGVVGYCLGGSLAWMAATRLGGVSAAVAYYGAQIPNHAEEKPRCPVLMHFGAEDQGIPLAGVDKVKEVQANSPGAPVEIHVYPGAGHGFSCDERASFHPVSHELALERTLAFLREHV